MLMHKDAITSICYNPKLRLHIIERFYKLATLNKADLVDYPDEWFMTLNGNTINIDKTSGFIYLNRIGFEANKELLQKTAEKAVREKLDNTEGQGWPYIEKYANEFFNKIVKHNEQTLKQTLAKALKLSETIKKLKPTEIKQETKSKAPQDNQEQSHPDQEQQ